MTFELRLNGGNCWTCAWIAAEGMITAETPDALRAFLDENGQGGWLVLNSGGGNLMAGVELGRLIREVGMGTAIGDTVSTIPGDVFGWDVEPGVCESACSFAFMGGVTRDYYQVGMGATVSGKLGMHQFYRRGGEIPSAATQQIMGQLLIYVLDMGIDPSVLAHASTAGAQDMYYFTPEEVAKYRLETSGSSTPFRFALEQDGLALVWEEFAEDGSVDKTSRLYCSRTHGAWLLRVEDFWSHGSSLGFEPENPEHMFLQIGDTRHSFSADDILAVQETDVAWALTVRLPVELLEHSGQPFDFRTSGLRNWWNHFAAEGDLPDRRQLKALVKTCVS